jgi:hypothetical protein
MKAHVLGGSVLSKGTQYYRYELTLKIQRSFSFCGAMLLLLRACETEAMKQKWMRHCVGQRRNTPKEDEEIEKQRSLSDCLQELCQTGGTVRDVDISNQHVHWESAGTLQTTRCTHILVLTRGSGK